MSWVICGSKEAWTSSETESVGLQGRGGRSGSRLQEVGASKEHITHRFPVPTIEAPVVGSAVTDALGHLLGPRGRIEVIALAENGGILAASYGVNPPS